MSDALAVQIDRSELTVGERVTATVRVLSDLPDVRRLTGHAEVTGANLSATSWGETELHQGPLVAGETFTFSVALPHDAPFSFERDGHDLKWHVVAKADISWVKSEVAKAPLVVDPIVVEPSERALAALAPSGPKPEQKLGIVAKVLLGALMVALGLSLLPLAPLLLIILANRRLERSRVTDFELRVPERHVALGEWIPITLRFRLRRPVDVASLRVKLDGTKRWKSGDSSRSHCFHEETVNVLDDVILAPREATARADAGGIYRRRARPVVEPGIFEASLPMQLPVDGWPTVDGKITYHVGATLELRGWPDPSAHVKLPTFSAVVEPVLERPHVPPIEEGSPGVAIVPIGEAPPPGVDITIAEDRIWPWIAIPTLGLAIALGSLLMTIAETSPPWLVIAPLFVLGSLAAGYGFWGFYTRLYR